MTTPLFSFAVMSDLHFMAWKETNLPVEWIPQVESAIRDIASLNPHFLILNGDLTNGKVRDYELAQRVLSAHISCPRYYTMGNHEYYGYYEDLNYSDLGAQTRFLHYTQMPFLYYEFVVNSIPFLCLSTEHYSPDINDAGCLSTAQLTWLQARLNAWSGHTVHVFFHQPVNETVAESNNTCIESAALRMLLQQHSRVILYTGHTHCRMDRSDQILTEQGVLYVGGGCPHGEHPQSRWVDVYADRIVIRIRDHHSRSWLTAYDFVYH